MNREFLKSIEGLTAENIDKIMAENGKDIQAEKEKATKAAADLADANKQLETYKATVADLEKQAGANADVKKQLEDLRAQIDAEKKAAEEKAADENMTALIRDSFPKDRKFVNQYTEQAVIQQIKAELSKPENKGKGVTDIFTALTKDQTGIFENPNEIQPLPPMGNPKPEGTNEAAMRRIFGLEAKQ